jgi:hypothetical protein
MITVLFYAFNKNRANEPQKNHHVLRRAYSGPILAHDDFLLVSYNKKTQAKILSGLSMS